MNWKALTCAIIGHCKEEDCTVMVTKSSREIKRKNKHIRTKSTYTGQLVCPRCGTVLKNLGEVWGFEKDFPPDFKNRANGGK